MKKILQQIIFVAGMIVAYQIGIHKQDSALEAAKTIAMDNKRTGELALHALDRAWLACATPFNQYDQEDDKPRSIRLR